MSDAVLQVDDLHVQFPTKAGTVNAVNGVSFSLKQGERLGLVGESGSGKTTTALALMRLLEPPAKVWGERAMLDGVDLLRLPEAQMRRTRFAGISMVPQGAMNSLNPVMRIRSQFVELFQAHGQSADAADLDRRIAAQLDQVGLKPEVAAMYPHELSGGMKQRVCIAMAVALRPKVIIADEPTSALDVVVQRQVMETLGRMQEQLSAAVILVGHDMGLMAQFADRIGVMYAGRLVEVAPVRSIFHAPMHPYTQMLIASIPNLEQKKLFRGIPGVAPSLLKPPSGCPFHVRCNQVLPHCADVVPAIRHSAPDQAVACHLYPQEAGHDTPA
jgi:oligopeptide/dipeptide ABC transporter ATP-binding protein